MANHCERCGRGHSGICGVPPGVTLAFGARVGGVRSTRQTKFSASGKPRSKRPSTKTLEILLVGAKRQLKKVTEMLIYTAMELPEYDQLQDREAKLYRLIKQIEGQIIERESR